jgi:hypothetical protein
MKIDISNASDVIDLLRDAAEKGAVAALATSDVRGEARVRMVVLRGFLKDDGVGPAVVSTTHGRSPKLRQIRRNACAEFVLWLEAAKLQIRACTSAQIIGPAVNEAMRMKVWRAMRAETQLTFWGPAPGTVIGKLPVESLPVKAGKGVPADFVVLVMRVRELDVTQISAGVNLRVKHVKTSRGWSSSEVVA